MKTYEFLSKSNPSARPHQTTVHDDGRVTCTCLASMHNRVCWHLKAAQDQAAHETPVVSEEDRQMLCRLLDKGNGLGALEALHLLLPSLIGEEAYAFLDSLRDAYPL